MNKIHFAQVISSADYRELICSTLNKHDVMFNEPVKDDEKNLYDYVKKNAADISNYDAFIIDLGALKDSDDQIMSAIESIRFLDDRTRIIIFESSRKEGYRILHQCFLNGIYNLIPLDNFIKTKENLENCILQGMSYKEALPFKEEERKESGQAEKKLFFQKKEYAFIGTQRRIGTTHCVLVAAYTLQQSGYLVAVIDRTSSNDYLNIMRSYEQDANDAGYFTIDEIDFYIKPISAEEITGKQPYNFILYDFGLYQQKNTADKELFQNADKILLTGSKPWELPVLSTAVGELGENKDQVKYLFNFTSPGTESELKKMMKDIGIEEKSIFFMEYQADFFSVSETMRRLCNIQVPASRKPWFRKRHK